MILEADNPVHLVRLGLTRDSQPRTWGRAGMGSASSAQTRTESRNRLGQSHGGCWIEGLDPGPLRCNSPSQSIRVNAHLHHATPIQSATEACHVGWSRSPAGPRQYLPGIGSRLGQNGRGRRAGPGPLRCSSPSQQTLKSDWTAEYG